jgi:tripartite-type tricarboxylate transporter receptor subunit TctC
MVRLVLLAIIALLSILQSLTSAPAQPYPARTVRFIVPFGAASGTDITARLFADRLAARWGKPVLVENRPGGDGLARISHTTDGLGKG